MDYLAQSFMRERTKRDLERCKDPDVLRHACMALIESNNYLRSMLMAEMEKNMPRLDSTGL